MPKKQYRSLQIATLADEGSTSSSSKPDMNFVAVFHICAGLLVFLIWLVSHLYYIVDVLDKISI